MSQVMGPVTLCRGRRSHRVSPGFSSGSSLEARRTSKGDRHSYPIYSFFFSVEGCAHGRCCPCGRVSVLTQPCRQVRRCILPSDSGAFRTYCCRVLRRSFRTTRTVIRPTSGGKLLRSEFNRFEGVDLMPHAQCIRSTRASVQVLLSVACQRPKTPAGVLREASMGKC